MKRVATGLALLLLLGLPTRHVHAGPPPDRQLEPPPPAKRQLPDYAGRGRDAKPEDGAGTWSARIVLSPLYALYEYGIRRPVGALIAGAERANVPTKLYDFFFFGPDHKAGVVPIGFVDFGFKASVGVYAFVRDAGFAGHELQFRGTTGGADWLAGVLSERFPLLGDDSLTLRLAGIRRPDLVYFGTGPDTVKANRSRYGEDRLASELRAEFRFWRSSSVEAGCGVRSVSPFHGHFAHDPSLEVEAATGAFPVPYGFDRGYTAIASGVSGAFDSRRPRPAAGSGFRLELDAEEGSDVRRSPTSSWLRYGASVAAFVDLNGRNRVIGLELTALFADPLHGDIPFTELVTLGGDGPMPSYPPGRLVGRSAAIATASYRWPIWVWLDGTLQASAGNVFDEHLTGFRASRIRFAAAAGVESVSTSGARDGAVQFLVGVGSETLEQGGRADSVRLALGTNRGF